MKFTLAIIALVAVAGTKPPVPKSFYYGRTDTRKGAQVLMDMARTSYTAAASTVTPFVVVIPPPMLTPDIVIERSLSPMTFSITLNDTNKLMQFSTNMFDWFDAEYQDPSVYSQNVVGYDFRTNQSMFFRTKP